jgi:N-methylhydantoinase B
VAVKKVLKPVSAMSWMVTSRHPLRGMGGGDDASPYSNRFLVGTPDEYKIDLAVSARLPADAVMAYQYGGGAGFGLPSERDPEAVKEDVLDEKVSVGRAREKYGVVLKGSLEDYDLEVDVEATRALRKRMSEPERAPSGITAVTA